MSGRGIGPPARRTALILAAVLAADQATKAAIRGAIPEGEARTVVPGLLRLVHVRNDGVAFGAFGGKPIVLAIVLVALAGLVVWFALHAERELLWLPTGLLLGGALGNVLDRVYDGAVTDFVKFPHWPAFNVADSAITLGVIALLIVLERGHAADRPA